MLYKHTINTCNTYMIGYFNSKEFRTAEMGSANGHATANAIALLAAILANGGSTKNIEIDKERHILPNKETVTDTITDTGNGTGTGTGTGTSTETSTGTSSTGDIENQQKHYFELISESGLEKAYDGKSKKTMFKVIPSTFCNAGWSFFQEKMRVGWVGWMGKDMYMNASFI